jgi:cytochrome c-type biogenesis protein CcmH
MKILVAALLVVAAQYAPQRAGSEPLAPALEARAQALGKHLRCTACQGVSIVDSPAQMARAQLDKVRELIREGRSDQEIKEYFVARYGEWILLSPKPQGLNLLVWVGPAALLLLGAWAIYRQVGRTPAAAPATPAPPPPSATTTDPYLAAIRSEVER